MKKDLVTASVVMYHTSHENVDNLLNSVSNSPIDVLYVIDNSENDDLKSYIEGRPKVKYIKNKNNGYGAGNNIAIKKAIEDKASYHVVINPDVYWTEDVIGNLINFMDKNPECGLVIPKNCNPDGSIRFICRKIPTPYNLILRRFIPFKGLNKRHDRDYQLKWTGYDKIMEVPVVSGCFMFMRVSVLSIVKGFDDRYFMYMEDVDLSRRIGEISKVMYYPNTFIYHLADRGSYRNPKLLKYHLQAAFKYFNKWGWIFDTKRRLTNHTLINKIKGHK